MQSIFNSISGDPDFWASFGKEFLFSALAVFGSAILFFIIVLLAVSYYRFLDIVEEAEKVSPDEMGTTAGEVLRVQIARYLAGCGRRGTSFSMALIKPGTLGFRVRMESKFVGAIKASVRGDDLLCVYDDDTAVLFLESEPEDAENILKRVVHVVADCCEEIDEGLVRVGIASYPGHGLSGKALIDVAEQGLAETSEERPIVLPEIVDEDAEAEEDDLEGDDAEVFEDNTEHAVDDGDLSGGAKLADDLDAEEDEPLDSDGTEDVPKKRHRRSRKEALLDPLTGVLKPSALSVHMQRRLGDLRYKKKKAALFCIGVNNMPHIARFHGEQAANDVLAGVSKVLQDYLRADDLVGRHEDHAFLVLSECTLEDAELIGKRLSVIVQQTQFASGMRKLKTSITVGVSAFPEHGRSLHQLYVAGQKVLDHSRENDIRAYAVFDPEVHNRMPSKPLRSIKSTQIN